MLFSLLRVTFLGFHFCCKKALSSDSVKCVIVPAAGAGPLLYFTKYSTLKPPFKGPHCLMLSKMETHCNLIITKPGKAEFPLTV